MSCRISKHSDCSQNHGRALFDTPTKVQTISSDQNNKYQKEDATCVAYQGRNGAEPDRVLVGTSSVCTQDTWVRWRAVLHNSVPHARWTRLDASERSLRNGSTRSQQLVAKSTAASTARIASSGHLACVVRALRAHGAVTGRSSHSWISPILLFVSSMSGSTDCQHF